MGQGRTFIQGTGYSSTGPFPSNWQVLVYFWNFWSSGNQVRRQKGNPTIKIPGVIYWRSLKLLSFYASFCWLWGRRGRGGGETQKGECYYWDSRLMKHSFASPPLLNHLAQREHLWSCIVSQVLQPTHLRWLPWVRQGTCLLANVSNCLGLAWWNKALPLHHLNTPPMTPSPQTLPPFISLKKVLVIALN